MIRNWVGSALVRSQAELTDFGGSQVEYAEPSVRRSAEVALWHGI